MKSKVYYTKEITPDSLIKIYDALGIELTGKVGIKVSTGEKGAKGYLKKDLISPLIKKLNGSIIECNTAYDGSRNNYEDHMRTAKEHGFTDIANIDIMDAEGEIKIPVKKGKHLKYDIIGKNFENYDSILNLAHGKGHEMGGFGANLKNQSIGIASRNGKAYIHSAGFTDNPDILWNNLPTQIDFIESMGEAATAVADYLKDNNKKIAYITVMNDLSLKCDCSSTQDDPVMEDLGIVASLDPVANDQAFIDMIWSSSDTGKELLKERIDSRLGREILSYSESLGLGSRDYELINIDLLEAISKLLKMSIKELLKTEQEIDENIKSYCQPNRGGLYLLVDKDGNYLCSVSSINPNKALETFKTGEKNKNFFTLNNN